MRITSAFLIGLIAGLFWLSGCGPRETERVSQEEWETLEDLALVPGPHNDGDSLTVEIDGEPVVFRLYWVDTVETNNRATARRAEQAERMGIAPGDEALTIAYAAKQYTADLLAKPFVVRTKWQRVDPKGDNPSIRAFVETDRGDLAELLVAEGLAMVKEGSARSAHPDGRDIETQANAFEQLRQQAREQRKGFWALSEQLESPAGPGTYPATDTVAIKRRAGETITVGGRIGRIGATDSGHITFLNFAGVPRGGFVVIVRERYLQEMREAFPGFPDSLEGKNVGVKGEIGLYEGTPQIALTDPDQLRILP